MSLKINLVFHAGETSRSISDTLAFLLEHAEWIDSVSAGPDMMYPGTELADNFESYARLYGTTFIPGLFWDRVHAYKINPSIELGFEQLNALAAVISKMLTNEPGYFLVKAHGQLPLTTTFESWRADAMATSSDVSDLPFSVEPDKWVGAVHASNPLAGLPEFHSPERTGSSGVIRLSKRSRAR